MPAHHNGIIHAVPGDRVSTWPATSQQLAEWLDDNMVSNSDIADLVARIEAGPDTSSIDIPLEDDWNTEFSSEVTAHRSGNVVTVVAWRLSYPHVDAGAVLAYTIPTGYRPPRVFTSYARTSRGDDVSLNQRGEVTITNPRSAVSHHSFTFVTTDPPAS